MRREDQTIVLSPRKKLNNIELDYTKLSEDCFWLRADQKLTRKLLMNCQRLSSWSAQNSDQRAFSYAAVIFTWENCLELMTNLPKPVVSSLK